MNRRQQSMAREIIWEIAAAGVSNAAIGYLEIQIDYGTWNDAKALAAEIGL